MIPSCLSDVYSMCWRSCGYVSSMPLTCFSDVSGMFWAYVVTIRWPTDRICLPLGPIDFCYLPRAHLAQFISDAAYHRPAKPHDTQAPPDFCFCFCFFETSPRRPSTNIDKQSAKVSRSSASPNLKPIAEPSLRRSVTQRSSSWRSTSSPASSPTQISVMSSSGIARFFES